MTPVVSAEHSLYRGCSLLVFFFFFFKQLLFSYYLKHVDATQHSYRLLYATVH